MVFFVPQVKQRLRAFDNNYRSLVMVESCTPEPEKDYNISENYPLSKEGHLLSLLMSILCSIRDGPTGFDKQWVCVG